MKAAEEIMIFYDQEVNLTDRIWKITECIDALVSEKKVSRVPRLLAYRRTLIDQFRQLETSAGPLCKGVFSQWDRLSDQDRADIQYLRDRIAANLGEVTLADKRINRLLEMELEATKEELRKISPRHALNRKYTPKQENDPRYFRLSA